MVARLFVVRLIVLLGKVILLGLGVAEGERGGGEEEFVV